MTVEKLNQHQKDLLIGTLLGDGNLQTGTDGRSWRYRALNKDKEYLFHKYEVLQPLCGSPPTYGETFDERTGKTYNRWSFNTLVWGSLRHYGNLFYEFDSSKQKMIKDVPENIELFLTPRAVAYLYMDDGALKWKYHSNAMIICTESFSTHGVLRLQKALKSRYNIQTTLTKKTRDKVFVGYRLAINEKNSTPFRELIRPYLVDSMKYKVSDGNYGHL